MRHINFRLGFALGGWFLLTVALGTCNSSASMTQSNSAPRFLVETWPSFNTKLTEQEFKSVDYRSENWPQVDKQNWPVPSPSSLCAWIDLRPLLEEGVDYRSGIKDRVSLIVDDNEIDVSVLEYELDLYVEFRLKDWRSPAIYSGNPYQLCWPVILKAGAHNATVSYQKASGQIVSNTLSFEIAGDSQ